MKMNDENQFYKGREGGCDYRQRNDSLANYYKRSLVSFEILQETEPCFKSGRY